MLENPKIIQSPAKFHPVIPPKPALQIQPKLSYPSSPVVKQCCRLSRRELTLLGNSSMLLLLSSQKLEPFSVHKARAEENLPDTGKNDQQEEKPSTSSNCSNRIITKKAFLDVSIDGDPVGRVIIGLYGEDAPVGVARFSGLASGTAGISYRRKEFIKIMPNYVQHGGVRSYSVDSEVAKRTGSDSAVDQLVDEWEKENDKCPGIKNSTGTVSIIVRDPSKPPPKLKLLAREGKLQIDQEEVGVGPNGTEFVIATKDSPELDASSLVVGRVLEGMEVVDRIGQVKTVRENTSSPYFRVAKLVGDKRAIVAERGFNRPYSKVVITNCGLMD